MTRMLAVAPAKRGRRLIESGQNLSRRLRQNMRATLVICLAVILSALGNTQAGSDPERIIRRIVDDGISEGHDQKVIGRLGDSGSVRNPFFFVWLPLRE